MNNKSVYFILTFLLYLLSSTYAYIDDTSKNANLDINYSDNISTDKTKFINDDNSVKCEPIYFDRSLSTMKIYSNLPKDLLLTIKQSYTKNNEKDNTDNSTFCDISTRFNKYNVNFEPFFETATSQDKKPVLASVGLRNSVEILNFSLNGKVSYEDLLVSNIVAAPALKVALAGIYKMNTLQSHLKFAYDYSNPKENFTNNYYKSTGGEIYSPDDNNISVMNVTLACAPFKNTFMSVDYYHYIQDKLTIQTYSKNIKALDLNETNGLNRDLGHEINLKTNIAFSERIKSELCTGWFIPGKAYSYSEDTKTFEIKGEIIVNF